MKKSNLLVVLVTLYLSAGLQISAAAENNQSLAGKCKSADSKVSDANGPSPFIGNSSSMKFHRRDCEFACVMAASRQVPFQNRQQAISAGMKPCNWCMPTWSTSVQGRLILQENRQPDTSVLGGAAVDSLEIRINDTRIGGAAFETEATLLPDGSKPAQ